MIYPNVAKRYAKAKSTLYQYITHYNKLYVVRYRTRDVRF